MAPAEKTQKSTNKVSKFVYIVDAPYTADQWPQVGLQHHNTILDLLVDLLKPIGSHRSLCIVPSKGKRSRKRKRTEEKQSHNSAPLEPLNTSVPEISRHILVGLNSTSRHMELTSKEIAKSTLEGINLPSQLAAIFVTKSKKDDLMYSHLPLLARTSSCLYPNSPPTVIVPLNLTVEPKLAQALSLPRVHVVGIMSSCPGASLLIDYVRDHIGPIEVPWVKEAVNAKYLGLKLQMMEPGTESDSLKESNNIKQSKHD
ncbi:hypothetical protein M501DRAFT_996536 [Patellaria atrata CBS 101060]|uniref:Uncharacterized protein n=1 Tax=Patellaria atrata CBS 101060 TaxID=1346257 RepID=A0A9P4S6H4_9PEZI|nr:hypothetical protein M501DRAFT_996536 [Patellaria atrata CBS 101060]